jgi:hypothetical protein
VAPLPFWFHWTFEVLIAAGVGGLVAIVLGRTSRRKMWIAFGCTALAAVALPYFTTNWDRRLAVERFERISPPSGWTLFTYYLYEWPDSHGEVTGRAFSRSFRLPGPVTTAQLLAYYQPQLPRFSCRADDFIIRCRSRLELFTANTTGETTLLTCKHGNPAPPEGQAACDADPDGTPVPVAL